MLRLIVFLAATLNTGIHLMAQTPTVSDRFVLVVHGGAGTILRSQMTPEREAAYRKGLETALRAGHAVISRGGSSLDAVTEAVKVLEDDPLFNAGKGAVFTNAGTNELDAAVMVGNTLAAGSVAGITNIKNPVTAARAVMEKSQHVMMVGRGAEQFAAAQGCEVVDPSYFHTESRWRSLLRIRAEDSLKTEMDHAPEKNRGAGNQPQTGQTAWTESAEYRSHRYGTVGAVALDKSGNLAAATSTGGMTNKKWGRVGDAPLIGIGTYANNATCAVSCTGWGEYFIRAVVAKTISDQMAYARIPLAKAAQNSIDEVGKLGGDGGLIAIDRQGRIAMPFNSEGMYRGAITADGRILIEIYK